MLVSAVRMMDPMPKTDTLADRMNLALERRGWSQYRLHKESGVSAAQLSRWLSGERGKLFDPMQMQRVADALEVHYEWLCTGRGSMRPSASSPPPDRWPERGVAVEYARRAGRPESAIRAVVGGEDPPNAQRLKADDWLRLIDAAQLRGTRA